jgi:hypothetical protein
VGWDESVSTLDPNAVIAKEKLTAYLLIPSPKDDKSKYLASAGYTLENWQQLEQDLRVQILPLEAIPTTKTPYGQKYAVTGNLTGVNGTTIRVKTIWMVSGSITRFVTLFPA